MTYTYYFRSLPDPRKVMPEKMLFVKTHREPEYDRHFHCNVYGKAVFLRQLSIDEQQEHGLIPDPRNHLAAVRKG